MTGNKVTLTEIRDALAAVEDLNLHFDESWDDEGTVTSHTWIGDEMLIAESGTTVEALEFIGRSREYVRALLAVCEALDDMEAQIMFLTHTNPVIAAKFERLQAVWKALK